MGSRGTIEAQAYIGVSVNSRRRVEGASGGVSDASGAPLGAAWARLGMSRVRLRESWTCLGGVLARLGSVLARLGGVLRGGWRDIAKNSNINSKSKHFAREW